MNRQISNQLFSEEIKTEDRRTNVTWPLANVRCLLHDWSVRFLRFPYQCFLYQSALELDWKKSKVLSSSIRVWLLCKQLRRSLRTIRGVNLTGKPHSDAPWSAERGQTDERSNRFAAWAGLHCDQPIDDR